VAKSFVELSAEGDEILGDARKEKADPEAVVDLRITSEVACIQAVLQVVGCAGSIIAAAECGEAGSLSTVLPTFHAGCQKIDKWLEDGAVAEVYKGFVGGDYPSREAKIPKLA
jgi:hypothetical protein